MDGDVLWRIEPKPDGRDAPVAGDAGGADPEALERLRRARIGRLIAGRVEPGWGVEAGGSE